MKKSLKFAAVLLSSTVLLGSCSKPVVEVPPVVEDDVKVVGVTVSESENVDCDYTKQLEATILPANATNKTVTWTSSNPKIATVDANGLVYGAKNGTVKIIATTEDGGYKAECEVTVSGYHKSKTVWENFGKIENNTAYNTEEGNKDFEIVTDNEDYTEVKFNRSTTREWASFKCWYNQIAATSLDIDVELVQGNLPGFLVEMAGELNFKQFWRVPLTVGTRTKVSYNLTDYNIKSGKEGDGSWGFMFFEFDNPNDGSDTNGNANSDVVLRFHKVQLKTDTAKKPDVVTGLKYDDKSKKLVFNKDTGASSYSVDVVKVDGSTETPLTLESQITRFRAIENIPGMKLSFIPKTEENFATVPGNYKARIKATNSVGDAEYCDYINFTIAEPEIVSSFESENFANNGAMYANQYNVNKTYAVSNVANGKKISFTGVTTEEVDSPSWDSILLDFDKTEKFSKFYMDFEVIKSANPIKNIGIQFNDWAESDPENSDGNQKFFKDITGETGDIHVEFDVTADLSLGLGNVGLMFDRTNNLGDVEIVVKKIGLKKTVEGYESENFANNGAMYANQYNVNKTYAVSNVANGKKISFTGVTTEEVDSPSWDSILLDFDKTEKFSKFYMDFEVIKSANPIKNIGIQFNDWAESEPENSDGNQKFFKDITGETGDIHVEFDVTADLSLGLGNGGLMFDRTNNLGDVEIVVKKIGLKKASKPASGYTATGFANDGAIVPNEYNGNKTYAAALTETGYKLTFTSSVTSDASWDSFLLNFDKNGSFTKFSIEFEVIKTTAHLTDLGIQFNDYGDGDAENDGKQQHWFNVASKDGKITETFDITTDLSKGLGTVGLMFDRISGTGDVEIMVYSVSLS